MTRPLDYFDEPADEPPVCSARLTDHHEGAIGPDGLCESCRADAEPFEQEEEGR